MSEDMVINLREDIESARCKLDDLYVEFIRCQRNAEKSGRKDLADRFETYRWGILWLFDALDDILAEMGEE